MSVQQVDLWAMAPLVVVTLGAVAVLVLDVVAHVRSSTVGWATLVVVAATGAGVAVGAGRSTLCTESAGCAYVASSTTVAFQGIAVASAAIVVLLSVVVVSDLGLPAGEYGFLMLASLGGALTVPAARDLVTLLVGVELLTLPLVALVALRRDEPRSAEAAVKLFLFSATAFAVSVYGVALVYGGTGAVRLADVAAKLSATDGPDPVAAVGTLLVLAVVLVKVAAVPLHAWAPDTYQGAAIPVAAYLAVVSKSTGVAALLLVLNAFVGVEQLRPTLAVVVATTIVVGNVAALRQSKAVRLLAWSSIAQAGYVLVPLAAPDVTTLPGTRVVLAYLVVYAAMTLGAFAVTAVVARSAPDPDVATFAGLARQRPVLGWSLALVLAALAGLPPGLAGLFVKVAVLAVLLAGREWLLAGAVVVGSVIGLAYYLRFAAVLFRAPGAATDDTRPVPRPALVAVGTCAAATLVLSVAPALAFWVGAS